MRLRHRLPSSRTDTSARNCGGAARASGGKVEHLRGEGEAPKARADKRARGGTTRFRTPSGGVSSHARKEAESHHEAMPGGRFPIRNKSDLMNAKHAIGRAKGDKSAVRSWINKRARALGAPPLGGSKDHKG